jgi:hypothetical protein
MPVEPIIEHGITPGYRHIDETGMLVTDCSWKPMRDEVAHKGSNRAVEYLRYEDPRLEGEIKGRPIRNPAGEAHGLANVHPGTAVDLANVADGRDIHGFVIDDDNVTVIGNPSRDSTDGDGVTLTIPFVYRPFIAKVAA